MSEIKCPNCGKTFQVDETSYNNIVAQIRNDEFDKELNERENRFNSEKQDAIEKAKLEMLNELNQQIAIKNMEIERLKSSHDKELSAKQVEIQLLQASNQNDIEKVTHDKDSKIKALEGKLSTLEKDYQILNEEKQSAIDKAKLETQSTLTQQLADKDMEIERLKSSHNKELNAKEIEIQLLQASSQNSVEKITLEKDSKIATLESKLVSIEKDNLLRSNEIVSNYEAQLRLKDEQIAQYKDFKAKLSTKMVGETLEKHCEIEFNRLRALGFQNDYFEKDSDIRTGSKGDYIYKAFADDCAEIVSIMFEMKNEADTTANKKKNEDFLKELDKDRKEKKCEYAVLVSMLEIGNPLYDDGIVDVSHIYEKMYVIRPQFFIPIITLLRNAAIKSLEYKKELAVIRNQNIDITNFENEMNKFKTTFGLHYNAAKKNFEAAIKQIDNSIECLSRVRNALTDSENALRLANQNAEDLSIKRLTKNNPTMQAKFDELKKTNN